MGRGREDVTVAWVGKREVFDSIFMSRDQGSPVRLRGVESACESGVEDENQHCSGEAIEHMYKKSW
jgi:hypothetical protein